MQLSRSLKNIIFIELLLPITLLIIGIYHGLMQTIYRSGAIHQTSAAHLDYYQGLTLHGVINAVVLTSFFAVAFGHATMTYHLKKEPNKFVAWLIALVNGDRHFACSMGNACRKSFRSLYILSSIKSASIFLSRCCFVNCWLMGSIV